MARSVLLVIAHVGSGFALLLIGASVGIELRTGKLWRPLAITALAVAVHTIGFWSWT